MIVRTDLYCALVAAGISEEKAKQLADAKNPDLEGALVATLGRLTEVLRALDILEDSCAETLGVKRTKRFAPRPPEKAENA